MVELPLRFVDLRFDLAIERMLGDRNVRIAVELGQLDLRLLLQRDELVLVQLQCVSRLVVKRAGHVVVLDQRRIPIIGDLIELDLRLLRVDIAQGHFVVGLHRFNRQSGCTQIGGGAVERDLKRQQVELKQQVAGLDGLALVDVDRGDHAGHIRRDQEFGVLHVGVVGGCEAPAAQPEGDGACYCDEYARGHQQRAQGWVAVTVQGRANRPRRTVRCRRVRSKRRSFGNRTGLRRRGFGAQLAVDSDPAASI